jgi:hypothetical protein
MDNRKKAMIVQDFMFGLVNRAPENVSFRYLSLICVEIALKLNSFSSFFCLYENNESIIVKNLIYFTLCQIIKDPFPINNQQILRNQLIIKGWENSL